MDELKRQTRMLDDDVKQLTNEVHRLNARQDRTDRVWRFVVCMLLAGVALIGLVAFVAFRAERTAREQEQLRGEVLCPLYGIFIGSYDPSTRDNSPDPNARKKYEDAYDRIRRGWQVMECRDPIVPPRTN